MPDAPFHLAQMPPDLDDVLRGALRQRAAQPFSTPSRMKVRAKRLLILGARLGLEFARNLLRKRVVMIGR